MPLYDMQCKICGKEFERACNIDERNDQRCPRCGEVASVLVTCLQSRDGLRPCWRGNLDYQPVFGRSRNRFKELCRKYGVASMAP